jgi:hypothetical protein
MMLESAMSGITKNDVALWITQALEDPRRELSAVQQMVTDVSGKVELVYDMCKATELDNKCFKNDVLKKIVFQLLVGTGIVNIATIIVVALVSRHFIK